MIARSFTNHRPSTDRGDQRGKALQSAIVFRNCSLKPHTSGPTRRVCRTLMREQAFQWRLVIPSAV